MAPDGEIETKPEWRAAGHWFDGEWTSSSFQWGVERCPGGEIFVVESRDGWETWIRNTDIPSFEAAAEFIDGWFECQVEEAQA
jgi:hypothetical protein